MSARREHRIRKMEKRIALLEDFCEMIAIRERLTGGKPTFTFTIAPSSKKKKAYRPLAALFRKK